ncbi:DUF6879 family protein [Pseudonocardia sp. CA-107938]|uniref:DUF6879 family protein n=1 Tax=Pseudonocardia sp. CA-107938 TaxID=3240021 RepID=UPI003D8CD37B
MTRDLTITTLWTAAWEDSDEDRNCPGEHVLSDRPDVHYVITRKLDEAAAAAYLAEHDITLEPGQAVGGVPAQMSADGHLVSTLVTDPDELAAFAELMNPREQLGTVPAADRSPILLVVKELEDVIDAHYKGPGDRLFHHECLPWYDVPAQNRSRAKWLAGEFDPATYHSPWVDRIAEERRRDMITKRLRILSEELTDDERASMFGGMTFIAREEIVRVLHRGEHIIPGVIDHDYWICFPVDGPPVVIRSEYTDGGAFVGSEVIPPPRHDLYLRDAEAKWNAGVPYEDWIAEHADLARTPVG